MWLRLGGGRLIREHRLTTRRCLARLSDADPRWLSDFEVWTVVEEWSGIVGASLQLFQRLERALQDRPSVHRYAVWRDEVHSDLTRLLDALRLWHLALADRFVERGWLDRRTHYFLLEREEIAAIVNGQRASVLREIVAVRSGPHALR